MVEGEGGKLQNHCQIIMVPYCSIFCSIQNNGNNHCFHYNMKFCFFYWTNFFKLTVQIFAGSVLLMSSNCHFFVLC